MEKEHEKFQKTNWERLNLAELGLKHKSNEKHAVINLVLERFPFSKRNASSSSPLHFQNAIIYTTVFLFIKGTFKNQQKKIYQMNGSTIPDCLDDSRCGSFFCVHIILDAPKIDKLKSI